MNNLTDKQLIHRAYLASPLWGSKRVEALTFYGTICGRCGEYGSDVHHKTYVRVGGAELMEDLEVVCRGCHEAHHRIERAVRHVGKVGPRSVNAKALFGYLTDRQRQQLMVQFGLLRSGLYADLCFGSNPILTRAALDLLGMDRCHGFIATKAPKPKTGKTKAEILREELVCELQKEGIDASKFTWERNSFLIKCLNKARKRRGVAAVVCYKQSSGYSIPSLAATVPQTGT